MENPIDELEAAIEIARRSYVSFRTRIDDLRSSIERYDPAHMTTAQAQTLKTDSLVVSDQTQRIVGQLELHLDSISLALAPMRAAFDRLLGKESDDGESWKGGPRL